MWDLKSNEYSEEYKMGTAYFWNSKRFKDAIVMYKTCMNSVLFFYSEYDLEFLTLEDKQNIESIIKKTMNVFMDI